ncbi:hypothetical protein TWF281_001515 [Arthrobotrys megalospora]
MLDPPHDPTVSAQEYQAALNAIPYGVKQHYPTWAWEPLPDFRMTWNNLRTDIDRPWQYPPGPLEEPWELTHERRPGSYPDPVADPWGAAAAAARRMRPDLYPEPVADPWAAADAAARQMGPSTRPELRPGDPGWVAPGLIRPKQRRPKLYPAGDPRGWASGHYWDGHLPGGSGRGGGMGGGGGIMGKRDQIVHNVEVDGDVSEGSV